MGKVQHRRLAKNEWEKFQRTLLSSFQSMGIRHEFSEPLLALFTKSEVIMLARRLQIARELLRGKAFHAIARELHIGLATVQFVHLWLEQHAPSYMKIFRKTKHVIDPKFKQFPLDPQSFRAMRARYPWDYALFNLLLGDPKERS